MSPSDGRAGAPARYSPGARRSRRGLLSAAAWRIAKRWLYLFHRWTGIILCLFFAIWFVSGIVMMYVPFPSFRAAERVATAPQIDWRQVRVRPDEALKVLNDTVFPAEMRLGMTGGEPVYRVISEDIRRVVSARTGLEIRSIDADRAKAIAAALVHAPPLSISSVDHDQWVVTKPYRKLAPFWKVRLADPLGTEIYVSRKTGEIVQNSTAHERLWNWLGAVPHWLYFEALRIHQEPWRQTILWTSGIGTLGATAGIWVGLLRVRLSSRYRSGSVSPYRGWMKWHHILGLVGGIFLLTWIFSGWLSMNPWGGLRDEGGAAVMERYRGDSPGFAATDLRQLGQSAQGATEVRFGYFGSKPVIRLLYVRGRERLLEGRSAFPLTVAPGRILAVARAAMATGKLVGVERVDRYDRYWYSTNDPRSDARPLPVLKLRFDDPARTWLYISPVTGELLAQMGTGRRSYRWLFAALHSFDLPWLLTWRPLREGLMWLLSAAGLSISITGAVIGWRRLRPAQRSRRRKSCP